jgi:hypothetical protein
MIAMRLGGVISDCCGPEVKSATCVETQPWFSMKISIKEKNYIFSMALAAHCSFTDSQPAQYICIPFKLPNKENVFRNCTLTSICGIMAVH